MASITTRSGKGSPLTNAEVDDNFTNLNTELGQKEVAANKGVANGYASLDSGGKVPSSQLPSYVDDVVEAANFAALPVTGETGKIYVTLDTNKTYRWSGSAYVEISATDFTGPATATDNAVTRFDGTTGKLVQNSGVTIDDSNNVAGVANLGFSGTGRRITGDFSSVPFNNRAAFQTSTANSATTVSAIPSGTGTSSQFVTHGGTDMGNTSRAGFNVNLSTNLATFFSDAAGTGTSLPMAFFTGGANRVWILTNGNVGIATGGTAASPLTIGGVVESTTGGFKFPDGTTQTTAGLSNSTTSTQSGYFGDIFLYDDSTPSHYLGVTNSANLTAARTLSLNVNDADRTISLSGNLTVSSAATISGTNTGDQTITLTGDVTGSGTGSFAATLANSGVVAGSYGSASAIPVITVDAKGRLTSVSTSAVSIPSGSLTFTGDVTGSGTTGSSTALTLANSGVVAGTYTKVTVDAKGRVTTGASLASGDVTTALGYTPLSNATSYLPLAGGTLTGSVEVTSGQNIRFGHANQSDGNDGKIGAALFGSGLNIVGTQTVANGGRIIRLWGSVQTDLGQIYIHTGNIGSYAPTLSGTGASGTWGISISGNSATTSQRNFSGDISTTGQGRFTGWYSGGAATGAATEVGYSGGEGYVLAYNRDTSAYSPINLASNSVNFRLSGGVANLTSGALQQGGNQVLHAGNYNSYAPTLTGGGASGTWSINVTGTSAGGTTLYLQGLGSGSVNVNNGNTAVYRTDSGSGAVLAYAPVLHVGGGDTMWQAQGTYGTSGNGTLYFRQGYNGSWGNWLTMLSSANYNSYAPTLTGGGASGTWGINITGNAATVTNGLTTSNYSSYALPLSGGTVSGATNFTAANNSILAYGNGNTGSSSSVGLNVYSTGGNGAIMNFHRSGYYAVNMGLDSDNVFRIGGWSASANLLQLNMSGDLTIPGRLTSSAWTTSARNYSNEWIEFPNYSGLYSPLNGAHFYPNNASYGSWRVAGSRNGWNGLEFDSSPGQTCLMISSNQTGTYNTSYGWQYYWYNGTLYCLKNSYGGGTTATVLDSSNYTSYVSGGTPTLSVTSSTSFTAAANTHYVIVGGATTVTLPTSPSAGTIVWITVANGRTDTVIARNGQNINSLAENMTVDSAFAGIQLRYADATRGWVFT